MGKRELLLSIANLKFVATWDSYYYETVVAFATLLYQEVNCDIRGIGKESQALRGY